MEKLEEYRANVTIVDLFKFIKHEDRDIIDYYMSSICTWLSTEFGMSFELGITHRVYMDKVIKTLTILVNKPDDKDDIEFMIFPEDEVRIIIPSSDSHITPNILLIPMRIETIGDKLIEFIIINKLPVTMEVFDVIRDNDIEVDTLYKSGDINIENLLNKCKDIIREYVDKR